MSSKATANPLTDQWEFLRGLIASPKGVGAIAPSSPALARAIAAQIDPARPGPVLELGPGTGVVTEALIERGTPPEHITAVEYDADFVARVRARCPGVNVVHGDAFNLANTLGHVNDGAFAAVVSGIPLLNWPMRERRALIDDALRLLQPGAPFVQFSYGLTPPVGDTDSFKVRRAAVIWANLPPARVWVYSRR